MADRELGMVEMREILRRWLGGDGIRAVARACPSSKPHPAAKWLICRSRCGHYLRSMITLLLHLFRLLPFLSRSKTRRTKAWCRISANPSSLTVGSCNDPPPGRLDLPPCPSRPLHRRCAREHRSAPSTDGPAAVTPSPSAPPPRPHPLGLSLTALGALAVQPPHCPARYCGRLAPRRLSTLLALEVPTPLTGSSADRPRDPHLDSTHGPRKSHLGSAPDSGRTPLPRL
jgi:hypothetical protein